MQPLILCAEAPPPVHDARSAGSVFQHVEIRALPVTIDYLPRRLDLAALQAGRMEEVSYMHVALYDLCAALIQRPVRSG